MRYALLAIFLLPSGLSYAAESASFIPSSLAQSDRIKVDGWDRYLRLGLSGNITDNNKVVGKTQGQSTTIGTQIEGAIDFKEREQEWLNSLNLLLSYSRSPQLSRYTKADDTLEFESLYKYYLADFSGVFTRLNLDTSMAPGYDDRIEDTNYIIQKQGGGIQTLTSDHLSLTQGLRPLKIRESLGVFTNLFDQTIFRMDIKGGLGMRQVIADKQRILADNKATPEVEVNQLRNSSKAGYEIGSEIGGSTEDKRFTYKLSANALFPFFESPDDGETGDNTYDKRVLDVNGKLSFHLAEWASFDYTYKLVRDPSIAADAQVSQSYLFSINQVLAARKS
jgi:hypothetical protein